MNTVYTGAVAYLAGAVVAWAAGRYGIDAAGQTQLTTDLLGISGVGAAGAVVVWKHLTALNMPPPPTGGTKA